MAEADERRRKHNPALSVPAILAWVVQYRREHGRFPTVRCGEVAELGGASGHAICRYLNRYRGGLRLGSGEPTTLLDGVRGNRHDCDCVPFLSPNACSRAFAPANLARP